MKLAKKMKIEKKKIENHYSLNMEEAPKNI